MEKFLGLGVEFEEERAFLGAGDEQIVARLGRALEGARLATAEQRVDGVEPFRRCRAQRLRQARAVQGHRAVAVADQGFHRGELPVR